MIAKKIRKQGLWILLIVIFISPANLSALNLSFKVSYGFSYMAVADTNDYLSSFFISNHLYKPFDHLHFAGHLSGEIYFQLKPRLSIFVGTGKILLSKNKNERHRYNMIHTFDHRIEAIPLLLGIRYDLNLSRDPSRYYFIPQVIVFVKAAGGYYFTTWDMTYQYKIYSTYWRKKKQTADANSFGASGAVGLEVRLTRLLSFVFEVSGRYLKVSDYQGEYRYSTSYFNYPDLPIKDTLYFYEYYQERRWLTDLQVCGKPVGPGVRNVRPAVVDFSGFSICIGLKINL